MTWAPPPRLLHETLAAAAAAHPSKPAVVDEEGTLTYGELHDRARRIARWLQDAGLERGDRVVLYLDNRADTCAVLYGTLLAGGVFVVVNPQTKADKLAFVLRNCEAAFLFADRELTDTARAAAAEAPSLRGLVGTAPAGGHTLLSDLLAGSPTEPRDPGTIPLDLAALIYTSGSTGQPKGVMMTHRSMVFAAASIAQYLRLEPDDRILCILPLAFDYGLYQLLMAVTVGGTVVLERSFAFPARTLERVDEERVTVFPGVPTVFATLLAMKTRAPHPSVRRVTNTAAALPPAFHDGLAELFPNALVFRMYGLTECKRVSYLEPELVAVKPSSVGRAIPGTEAFVLDEARRPVAPGETGVLYVRGPHVMAGYWNLPDETDRMLVDGPLPGERMLCTHDYFTVDEDGLLTFVGRSDDIIKTRGEKVSPIEVENALHGIRGVKEAAVVGVPDEVLGEAIRAYVVLDGVAPLDERAIVRACRERLEAFMVPRDVVLLDKLPQTDTGKVRKRGLAAVER